MSFHRPSLSRTHVRKQLSFIDFQLLPLLNPLPSLLFQLLFAQVDPNIGECVVMSTVANGPAQIGGVLPGDAVLEVDGQVLNHGNTRLKGTGRESQSDENLEFRQPIVVIDSPLFFCFLFKRNG
jgi:S1-C subfamily serine protease